MFFYFIFFFSFLSGAEFHDQVIHDCSPRDRELKSFHHSISYNIIFINSFVVTVSVVESVSRKTFLSRSAFTSVSCFTLSTNSFVFLNSFQSCFFLFGEFSESEKISPFTQYRRRISYFPRSLIFSKYTTSEEYFRQIISTRICRVENSRKSYGSVREREGGAESGRVYVRSLAHLSTH